MWARTVSWFRFLPQARSSVRMGLSSWITRIDCSSAARSRYSCWLRPDWRTFSRSFFASARVTRKAITWFLVRTAMFHHLRIKIWYAAAPSPGTTTYQNFLWIAISNRQSYQKVINWPRRAEKVGAGFCPQKGVWRPLAASQTLCLPHPRVGKIALPDRLLLTATDALPHCGKTQHFYFICFFYHSPPRL